MHLLTMPCASVIMPGKCWLPERAAFELEPSENKGGFVQVTKKLKVFRVLSSLIALLLLASLALSAGCASSTAPQADKAKGSKPAEVKQESAKTVESKTDDSKAVTLKAATAWPKDTMENEPLWMLQKMVEAKSNGNVKINWTGGPEAIPSFQLMEALRNGVVDMALTSGAYSVAQVPEAAFHKLSQLTPSEERANGAFDLFNKVYQEKGNAVLLGRGLHGKKFRLYTNTEVKSSADFKGLRIRVTPIYKAFVESLGAAAITIDPGEVYTALERKVVDGYGWPEARISDYGWQEVTKYAVQPPFFVVDVLILVNKNAWDKLSTSQKNLMTDSMKQVEKDSADWVKGEIDKENKLIQEKGVKLVTLSDGDAYVEKAYKAGWEDAIKQAPGNGPKLKELLTKK